LGLLKTKRRAGAAGAAEVLGDNRPGRGGSVRWRSVRGPPGTPDDDVPVFGPSGGKKPLPEWGPAAGRPPYSRLTKALKYSRPAPPSPRLPESHSASNRPGSPSAGGPGPQESPEDKEPALFAAGPAWALRAGSTGSGAAAPPSRFLVKRRSVSDDPPVHGRLETACRIRTRHPGPTVPAVDQLPRTTSVPTPA